MDAIGFHRGSCIVSILLVNLINIGQSGPPEYCLSNLNVSDCGGPPTPVAYYYKSGSRCEVATWRGCPTQNKFRDEVICSHICIASILRWSSEELSGDANKVTDAPVDKESENEIELWEQELDLVPEEEMQKIDELVDDLANDVHPKIVKLHFQVETTTLSTQRVTEATTEKVTEVTVSPETSASTESVTEEATTEAITTTTDHPTEDDFDSGDPEEVITT